METVILPPFFVSFLNDLLERCITTQQKQKEESLKPQRPSLPQETLKLFEAFFCAFGYNFHR